MNVISGLLTLVSLDLPATAAQLAELDLDWHTNPAWLRRLLHQASFRFLPIANLD
jgi:hypothetical protein